MVLATGIVGSPGAGAGSATAEGRGFDVGVSAASLVTEALAEGAANGEGGGTGAPHATPRLETTHRMTARYCQRGRNGSRSKHRAAPGGPRSAIGRGEHVRLVEGGPGPVGLGEVGVHQVRRVEPRSRQRRPPEASLLQVCVAERGAIGEGAVEARRTDRRLRGWSRRRWPSTRLFRELSEGRQQVVQEQASLDGVFKRNFWNMIVEAWSGATLKRGQPVTASTMRDAEAIYDGMVPCNAAEASSGKARCARLRIVNGYLDLVLLTEPDTLRPHALVEDRWGAVEATYGFAWADVGSP